MFLLIKWVKHNSTTILKETEEYESNEVGDKIRVLYGKEYHEGIILSRSGKYNSNLVLSVVIYY